MNKRKTRKMMKGGSGNIRNFRKNYINLYFNSLNTTKKKKGKNERTGLNMDLIISDYQKFKRDYLYKHRLNLTQSISNRTKNTIIKNAESFANSEIMKQRYSFYIIILENLIDEYLWNHVFYPNMKHGNSDKNSLDLDEKQAKEEYYTKYGRDPNKDAVEFAIQVMDTLIKERYISYGPRDPQFNSKYQPDLCDHENNSRFVRNIRNTNNNNIKICKEVGSIKNKIAKQILEPSFFNRFF